jgi:hypothetical protein
MMQPEYSIEISRERNSQNGIQRDKTLDNILKMIKATK